jgi:hypothetical protein
MNNQLLTVIVSGLILAGCASNPDPPPKHMDRIKVLMYDSTRRAMTPRVELYDDTPPKQNKVIALITCEGSYREEIVMKEAIIYKARQLGAEAVVWKDFDKATAGGGSMYGFSAGGRRLFRGEAVVFEPPVPPTVPAR